MDCVLKTRLVKGRENFFKRKSKSYHWLVYDAEYHEGQSCHA